MRRRGLPALLAAVAAAAVAVGCGSGAERANKAGGSAPPVVLRMADGYNPALELEPAVAYFVRRVRQVSKGQLRIKVVDNWAGTRPEFEQQVVRAVAAGLADVGWVGTRIFDTLGVNSFQALTAPMLIDNYRLERTVIASDIPAQMLAGLDKVGVTGLGLLGDGLRKPISLRGPLLRPIDWRGIRFAVFRSRGQADAIHSLGARTTDIWGPALQDAVGERKIDGFEKHYFLWDLVIDPASAPYVAANVNLWPETVALLANPQRLSKLSDSERAWLRQASADAAARSTSLFANEATQVRRLCNEGARFSNASTSDLAAMRAAFSPAYAHLEQDSQTRDFIARIEQLKQKTLPEPAVSIPPRCAGPAHANPAAQTGRLDPAVLDGVYRVALEDQELKAAGPLAAFSRRSYGGVITMTLRNGRFRFHPRTPPECTGTYAVSAKIVRFRFDPQPYCQGVVNARWSLAGGQLRLRVVSSTNPYDSLVWGGKPWKRIG
jgi:TRAP-type C4-dicarboxylate transport system substrate-binding protein